MRFDNFVNLYFEIKNTQTKSLKWEDRRDKNEQGNNFCFLQLYGFFKQYI